MKLLFGVPLAALATLWLSSAALAGGWAVTTLDPLPQTIQAGQAYRIGYVIRQHGVAPFTQAHPRIVVSQAHGSQLSFAGFPEGAPGHYVSDVSFPSDGEWTWVVDQNPFPVAQELGTVGVGPAQHAIVAEIAPIPVAKAQPSVDLAMVAMVALLLGWAALGVVQVKRVTRPAATTATAQIASMLTQARRSTPTPSRS